MTSTITPKPEVDDGSFEFVITETSHICGYPGCSRRFRYKRDLQRHQTKEHGRHPGRSRDDTSGADDIGDKFIIVESSHICGYPECSKRFHFRRDLLRHQTKYHGRQPVRSRKTDATADGYDGIYGYFQE